MLAWVLIACFSLAVAVPTPSVSHVKDIHHKPADSRIIGGSDAAVGEFPWQATLQQRGRHYCGATLITARHVMTAAHCYTLPTTVGLGAVDYRYPEQNIAMQDFTAHPQYNSNTFDYDYAVITLVSEASLGSNVQTIKLVEAGKEYTGTARASGWGYDARFEYQTPYIMQKTDLPLMSAADCQSVWGSVIEITNRIQCVGGDGRAIPCNGDSGGPLTVVDNGEIILIGAFSWMESTCNPAYPGGYAKLSAVRSWIDGIID